MTISGNVSNFVAYTLTDTLMDVAILLNYYPTGGIEGEERVVIVRASSVDEAIKAVENDFYTHLANSLFVTQISWEDQGDEDFYIKGTLIITEKIEDSWTTDDFTDYPNLTI